MVIIFRKPKPYEIWYRYHFSHKNNLDHHIKIGVGNIITRGSNMVTYNGASPGRLLQEPTPKHRNLDA